MAQHVQFKSDSKLVLSHWYRCIKLNPMITTSFEVYRWLKTKLYVKTAPWWELWHKWDPWKWASQFRPHQIGIQMKGCGEVSGIVLFRRPTVHHKEPHTVLWGCYLWHIYTLVLLYYHKNPHTVLWSCNLWHQHTGVTGLYSPSQSSGAVTCDTKTQVFWAACSPVKVLCVTALNTCVAGLCTLFWGCYLWLQ